MTAADNIHRYFSEKIRFDVSSERIPMKTQALFASKAPIKTAAVDIHKYFFIVFQRK